MNHKNNFFLALCITALLLPPPLAAEPTIKVQDFIPLLIAGGCGLAVGTGVSLWYHPAALEKYTLQKAEREQQRKEKAQKEIAEKEHQRQETENTARHTVEHIAHVYTRESHQLHNGTLTKEHLQEIIKDKYNHTGTPLSIYYQRLEKDYALLWQIHATVPALKNAIEPLIGQLEKLSSLHTSKLGELQRAEEETASEKKHQQELRALKIVHEKLAVEKMQEDIKQMKLKTEKMGREKETLTQLEKTVNVIKNSLTELALTNRERFAESKDQAIKAESRLIDVQRALLRLQTAIEEIQNELAMGKKRSGTAPSDNAQININLQTAPARQEPKAPATPTPPPFNPHYYVRTPEPSAPPAAPAPTFG